VKSKGAVRLCATYTVVAIAAAITPSEMKKVNRSRRRRRFARVKERGAETWAGMSPGF
jgi:hypothetical protein